MRRSSGIVVLAAVLAATAIRGETTAYAIAIPPDAPASYEVPIPVRFAGRLVVDASWTGGRLLSFRLVRGENRGSVVRRSGPSPQRIEIDVSSDDLARGSLLWGLEIRALATRDRAEGTVNVTVPDAPEVVAAREEAAKPPPPPPPVPDRWAVARRAPAGAPPRLARLFVGVEALRASVYGADPFRVRDGCGWQSDLTRWVADRRDDLASGAAPPSPESLRYLAQIAHAVRSVEQLRTSTSPLIAGPVPDEALRRRAWTAARRDLMRPIERELDRLADRPRGGFVPELSAERWPSRLVACLTAAQRSFAARAPSAPAPAEGAEVADAQWPRILAAGSALEALAAWLPDVPAP